MGASPKTSSAIGASPKIADGEGEGSSDIWMVPMGSSEMGDGAGAGAVGGGDGGGAGAGAGAGAAGGGAVVGMVVVVDGKEPHDPAKASHTHPSVPTQAVKERPVHLPCAAARGVSAAAMNRSAATAVWRDRNMVVGGRVRCDCF